MKKAIFVLLAIVFTAVAPAQTSVAGATLPNTVSFEGEKLVLNGAGVREKFWMDMYAGGLYLQKKSSNDKSIVAANEPMALKIHIVSKLISSDKMIDAVDEGFEAGGNKARFSSEIEEFKGFFRDEISKNDVFDIVYIPNQGTIVYKNGTKRGTIEGEDFKKALFSIWLSDKPADKKLKAGMLGRS